MERFFGGHPALVVLRLVIISIVVGVVLHTLGLSPFDLIESVRALMRYISEIGADVLEMLLRYLLIGAVIVVPIWLLVRVVKALRNPSPDKRPDV
jgi:hypothetical protein